MELALAIDEGPGSVPLASVVPMLSIILEEAPERHRPNRETGSYQTMVFSREYKSSPWSSTRNFAPYLKRNPPLNLADAAYTLQVGRKELLINGSWWVQMLRNHEALYHRIPEGANISLPPEETRKACYFHVSRSWCPICKYGLRPLWQWTYLSQELNRCFNI